MWDNGDVGLQQTSILIIQQSADYLLCLQNDNKKNSEMKLITISHSPRSQSSECFISLPTHQNQNTAHDPSYEKEESQETVEIFAQSVIKNILLWW